ncbi:MAG: B3/B4 domain-containing protein [Promethearchaeota archaeon]
MELIQISRDLREKGIEIILSYIKIDNINVKRMQEPPLINYIQEVINNIRCKYTIDSVKYDEVIRAYRDFYWHFLKIDPTKQRPSSEALIRRILANKNIPRISNFVDLNNWVSIDTKIPLGAYDFDKLETPLISRFASKGEEFIPIGGKNKILKGNEIIMADSSGLIIHLFPHRDSNITKITQNTKSALVVACGVSNINSELTENSLKKFAEILSQINPNIQCSKIKTITSV